jgi:hypothetical protein
MTQSIDIEGNTDAETLQLDSLAAVDRHHLVLAS